MCARTPPGTMELLPLPLAYVDETTAYGPKILKSFSRFSVIIIMVIVYGKNDVSKSTTIWFSNKEV